MNSATDSEVPKTNIVGELPYYLLAAGFGFFVVLFRSSDGMAYISSLAALAACIAMFLRQSWAAVAVGSTLGVEIVRFIAMFMMFFIDVFIGDEMDEEGWLQQTLLSNLLRNIMLIALCWITLRWEGARLRWADKNMRSQWIITAVRRGSIEQLERWIATDADVNYVWPNGKLTALVTAATKGNADAVALLLEAGANPTLQGRGGLTKFSPITTPLEAAKSSGCDRCVQLIEGAIAQRE